MFNINLDTTSDFMFDDRGWPGACCDVMIESLDLTEMAYLVFDKKPDEGYVDLYAKIEPERRLVTEFLMIYKDEDGKQDDMTIKVTDLADSVEYYKTLEHQGGKDFAEFIGLVNVHIHDLRCKKTDSYVRVVDQFLDDRNVDIPTSLQELECNEGYNVKDRIRTRICGSDYGVLAEDFELLSDWGLENVVRDRLKALDEWFRKYLPDEDEFYSDLFDAGFTGRQIEDALGEDAAEATKTYWREHGYI